MERCCIVYGSETGSTEIAAHTTYFYFHRNGVPVDIHLSDLIDLNHLLMFECVVFFVPTCAYGEFPHNFESLVNRLLSLRDRKKTIPGLRYTIFGLGDSRYPLYNYAARRLQSLLKSLNASEFFSVAFGDDQHPLGFDGELIEWREDLLKYFKRTFKVHAPRDPHNIVYPFKVLAANESKVERARDVTSVLEYVFSKFENEDGVYDRGDVVHNKIITSETHFTNVRSIAIRGGRKHKTGDVLCVFPTDNEAEAFLRTLGYDPSVEVTLSWNWSKNMRTVLSIHNEYKWYPLEMIKAEFQCIGSMLDYYLYCFEKMNVWNKGIQISSRKLPLGMKMTLSELFTKHLCLRNLCTPFQMYVMAQYTEDELHKGKLLEMAGDTLDGCLEYYRYCKSERRSLYDVLYDFPSVKLPLEVLVNIATPYYSRLYSIANSELDFVDKYSYTHPKYPLSLNYPQLKAFLDYKKRGTELMVLCAADVNYKTPFNRSVDGICSKFLTNLKLGDNVDYLIYRPVFSRIVLDIKVAVLFIATGTGITVPKPYIEMRCYKFKEMWRRYKTFPDVRDMAFIGFRRPNQDHLYTDFHVVKHFCKFVFVYSRLGTTKFYVQDSIRQHAKEVYPLLRGGLVVIGGRSHPMPSQVLEALAAVLEQEGGFGCDSAKRFIDQAVSNGKIIIDTWG